MNIDIEKYNSQGYLIIDSFLRNSELTEFELNISNLCDAKILKLEKQNEPL